MTTLKGRLTALVAAAALALPTAVKAEEFINILTGGTSGVYYPLGVGLSKIYGDNIAGARTQVQSTKASVENLNLLQHRGRLSELHPDRRVEGQRHHLAGPVEGQEPVGRGAEIGDRAERPRHLCGGGNDL